MTPRRHKDLYPNLHISLQGKQINITPHRFLTFNNLLNDLTSRLPMSVQLPYGVRQVFTPVGGHRVRDIEDLQDGGFYVCGGFENFKKIKYGGETREPWQHGRCVLLVTPPYNAPRYNAISGITR